MTSEIDGRLVDPRSIAFRKTSWSSAFQFLFGRLVGPCSMPFGGSRRVVRIGRWSKDCSRSQAILHSFTNLIVINIRSSAIYSWCRPL